ncbi:RHS repeat-associated core domain-containing protein [Streptomyces sp. PSRA5]
MFGKDNRVTSLGGRSFTYDADGQLKSDGKRTYDWNARGQLSGVTPTGGGSAGLFTYDPYGKPTSSGAASTNPYTFTGREFDGTGLLYYRNRYYDPESGRFISQDPTGYAGGTNLYQRALSSPTTYTDPTGNSPMLAACVIGGLGEAGLDWLGQRSPDTRSTADSGEILRRGGGKAAEVARPALHPTASCRGTDGPRRGRAGCGDHGGVSAAHLRGHGRNPAEPLRVPDHRDVRRLSDVRRGVLDQDAIECQPAMPASGRPERPCWVRTSG